MKNFLPIVIALLLCGCRSAKLEISGRMVGTKADRVYLEQFSPTQVTIIDSALLDEKGNYRLLLHKVARTPELYTLRCGGEIIPLLLEGGDRVQIDAIGNITRNYTIQGSEESERLRSFYQPYAIGLQTLDRLAALYGHTAVGEQEEVMRQYAEEFRRIKREQLRFIVEHKHSLAALYALYQRLPGDPYLFNDESDAIYYRTVAEALQESYPDSRYLKMLEEDLHAIERRNELLSQVRERSYPDLEMSAMYGEKIRLSSLDGKVILLDFWSAELGNSNQLNVELKGIYERFSKEGFEIYQVAVDRSKPRWIHTVQEQGLPWISVSDLQGENSLACRLYQVAKLPSNFLIDREGNIVGRDLYGEALERRLKEIL